jgi:hypothetical protein
MRAASSRIWSPIPDSDQSNDADVVDHSISGQPASINQLIGKPLETTSKESIATHESASRSGYWSQDHSRHQDGLVDGYTKLVTDRVHDGCSLYLVTFLFHQFPGPRGAVLDRMKDEVHRVYSTLLTRVVRRPKTASTDALPVLIGVADLPVYKRNRASAPMISCNDGLHLHALVLMPPASRLTASLADHFEANVDMYAGPRNSIQSIDVRPVTDGHSRVVDYVFKTVLNRRLTYDEAVLVLPRVRDELHAAGYHVPSV